MLLQWTILGKIICNCDEGLALNIAIHLITFCLIIITNLFERNRYNMALNLIIDHLWYGSHIIFL